MKHDETSRQRGLACVSSAPANPYLRLLYGGLAAQGFSIERCRLTFAFLIGARQRIGIVHIHWPEGLYRASRGPEALRGALSWLNLVRLTAKLTVARALGYRIVWTVHQPLPHERRYGPLDRFAASALVASAHLLLVHDDATRAHLQRSRRARAKTRIVPHGSYEGVYRPGRLRAEMRRQLGLGADSVAFLVFGEIRAYKDLGLLLDAFDLTRDRSAKLIVAGHPRDPGVTARLHAAAARDRRIKLRLEFIPDTQVAELFHAADVAVIARSDGGTSGALILALTMGLPVIAAAGAYGELVDETTGWAFQARDAASLAAALEAACNERSMIPARGRAAGEVAARLSWPEIARRLTELFDDLRRPHAVTPIRRSQPAVPR